MQDNNHEKPNNNRNNEADESRNVRKFADGASQQRRQVRPQGAGQRSQAPVQRTASSNMEPHAAGQRSGQPKAPQRRRPVPPEASQQYFEQSDMSMPRPQQRSGQSSTSRQRPVQARSTQSEVPRQRPQQPRSGQSATSRPRPAQSYSDQSDVPQRRSQQYSSQPYMEEETYPQSEQEQPSIKKKNAPAKKNTSKKTTKKKKQSLTPEEAARKKRNKILLFVGEILLLLVLVVSFWAVTKVRMAKFVKINDGDLTINKEVQQQLDTGESVMKGYRNIALFGVDSREGELEKSTRTDTIIIASINLDTHEVRLVSVYRDTWLNLSTDTYSKANAAYAKGGPKQAINMLNMNLDMNITDFVTAGFDGLIDLVDAVGGIEIDVKESEIENLNSYQISIVGKPTGTLNANGDQNFTAEAGVDYTPVTHAGLQTLNGLQATAYCRIRYVGNGDFERTQRQQRVLKEVAKKAITFNPSTLNKIAEAVFPKIATSLEWNEILSLLGDIAQYEIGETSGFPFEGNVKVGRVGKASVVVPVDLEQNVKLLHEFLFGAETEYTPSDTVKKCSQKIAADTGVSVSGS